MGRNRAGNQHKRSPHAQSSNGPKRVTKANRKIRRNRQSRRRNRRAKRELLKTRAETDMLETKSLDPELELNNEQGTLIGLILNGQNIFYTGAAGCGKSTVLKAFVRRLQENGKRVEVIAPTGRAALEVNGCTFWTYAGWTPNHMKRPLAKIKHKAQMRKRLSDTDVLVLDEVSMVEIHHFERLNVIMKEARQSDKPFGGVQLIVTGDFCQLPPVKPFTYCLQCGREMIKVMNGFIQRCLEHGDHLDEDKWAFRSEAWNHCNFSHVYLRTIYRQKEKVFTDLLERFRLGRELNEEDIHVLLNHNTNVESAVRLFPTREEVRRVNSNEFNRLPTEKRIFNACDSFEPSLNCDVLTFEKYNQREPDGSLQELRDHRFESFTEIKEGMQVILLVNLDIGAGLVNGSQGKVVGWESFESYNSRHLTSDRSNDMKQDCHAEQDVVIAFQVTEHRMHQEQNIQAFMQKATTKEWPIVLFENGLKRTIIAFCYVNEIGNEEPWSLLSRTQIPLLAAWAISIHKSQGMTLNKVIVDLSKSFEEGQMYVALSRASSLAGLKVTNLGNWRPRGNEQVKRFLCEKFGIR